MTTNAIHLDEHARRQLRDGRVFVLEAPITVPALWGEGTDVAWAAGESLFIVGPQGVGKTSLAQQLVLKRHGITEPHLLGLPVEVTDGLALYLACDRPQQIARSMRRMVSPEHAQRLASRFKFWSGPLPFDVVREPTKLAAFAHALHAETVVIDSLKDIAFPLSDDKVGAAVNRALAAVIASGGQVIACHHNRKANVENRKPSTLADVYGSTWITSGAGSVISLWGDAGDPIVALSHLKQPADDIGPLDIEHDHQRGVTRRQERADAWSVLRDAGPDGVTANDAAAAVYGKAATRAQVEKIRRRLQGFTDKGDAAAARGRQPRDPVVYRATPQNGGVQLRVGTRVATREPHGPTRNPGNIDHARYTHPNSSVPPLGEGPERVTHEGPADGRTDDELQAIVDRSIG